MFAGTLITVEEYLGSVYRPDCDYVDGRLEERNVGERCGCRSTWSSVFRLSGWSVPRSGESGCTGAAEWKKLSDQALIAIFE